MMQEPSQLRHPQYIATGYEYPQTSSEAIERLSLELSIVDHQLQTANP